MGFCENGGNGIIRNRGFVNRYSGELIPRGNEHNVEYGYTMKYKGIEMKKNNFLTLDFFWLPGRLFHPHGGIQAKDQNRKSKFDF